MVTLTTLGPITLSGEDGRALHSVLTQPKRLALLLYLAVDAPAGLHRRDKLLGLFWPELDEERARAALRQAVYYLRRSLGEGALLSRGDGEVGIDPDVVRCDVREFQRDLDSGNAEEALARYGGALAEGLHVADAPEFERWLAEERLRLGRSAVAAAWALARSADARDDAAAALEWAQRALALAPGDEAGARWLIAFLDRWGDRAGAIRAYEQLAERLRIELDAEPSAETQALLRQVRERDEVRMAPPAVPPAPTAVTVAAAEPEPWSAAARPPRRGRWLAAGGALTVLIAGAMAAFPLDRPSPLRQERVLVAPFENRTGDPELDLVGDMAAEWVTQGLQQTGLVEVVDPMSGLVMARGVASDSGHLEGLARAAALAHAAGAGVVIWGAVYRQSDSLLFRAQATRALDGTLLLAIDPVVAPVADATGGVERLRERVAGAVAFALDERTASINAPSSRLPTFEAYRAYIEGLEAFVAARQRDAIPHFASAARLDTTFALPLIWSIFAYGNTGQGEKRDSVIRVLAARRETLSPLDRHALDYFEAGARGDLAAELTAARAAARLSPGSNWSHNAGVRALALGRPHEAIRHLEQVDPERGWAKGWFAHWRMRADAYHLLREHEQELLTARRALRISPDQPLLQYLEIRALIALGRQEEARARTEEMLLVPPGGGSPPGDALRVLGAEQWAHGDAERAQEMFRAAVDWYRSPAAEGWIAAQPDATRARRLRVYEGAALYSAGRWDAAHAAFQTVRAEDPADLTVRAYLGMLSARRGERAHAEGVLRSLEDERQPGRESPLLHQARLAALLGDKERATGYLREMLGGRGAEQLLTAVHRESDFSTLRGHPPFEVLVRTRE
jgi:DNA-binding SARP family transcriptional activator/TolB-like protein